MQWVQKAYNFVNRLGQEGGKSAEAVKVDGGRPVLCPRGMVTSLHNEVSAFLTQRVIMELALIIAFPSVAAIDQRDA